MHEKRAVRRGRNDIMDQGGNVCGEEGDAASHRTVIWVERWTIVKGAEQDAAKRKRVQGRLGPKGENLALLGKGSPNSLGSIFLR